MLTDTYCTYLTHFHINSEKQVPKNLVSLTCIARNSSVCQTSKLVSTLANVGVTVVVVVVVAATLGVAGVAVVLARFAASGDATTPCVSSDDDIAASILAVGVRIRLVAAAASTTTGVDGVLLANLEIVLRLTAFGTLLLSG